MKRLTLLFLAMLFPLAAHAVIRSQVYTTNGEPAVDAHVIALITGPTNGISLATASNVINGMATTLSVLHSTNTESATLATNALNAEPGGNILSYAPKSPRTFYIATNGAAATAQTNSPNYPWGTNDYITVFAKAGAGDKISFFPGNFFNISNLTVPVGVTVEGYNRNNRPNIICASNGLGTACFFLSDNTSLKDLKIPNWYAGSYGATFNIPFQPIATGCTNVLIDNCFIQGQQDALYWDSTTVYTEMVIQNCFITCSNWDVALFSNSGLGGRIKSINNVWVGGSAVVQSRLQFGNIAFTDYGSLIINTNRSGPGGDWGIGGANLSLHGTRFNLSVGHGQFVVDANANAITNGFYTGDYIDEDTGNAYALTPDRAYSYVSSITTNGFTYTYNTNIYYYSGSGSNQCNVAYTNNLAIGAWTNGVTGKVMGLAFVNYYTIMQAPYDSGGGSDDYSTAGGGLTILQLNGALWTADTGPVPPGTGYFATNTVTPILVTNYSVGFFRGALVNSNGMWYSPGGYEGAFTGNGAGLTNLQASAITGGLTVVQTNSWGIVQSIDYVNIDSGKLYTNTTAGNQKIHAHGHVWFAADVVGVSSATRLDMIVNDQYTNSLRWALNQGASTPIQGDVEGEFVAEVPPGGFYYWTNLSSGGGGSPTNEIINPVQIITTSNIVSRFYFTNGVLMNTTTP